MTKPNRFTQPLAVTLDDIAHGLAAIERASADHGAPATCRQTYASRQGFLGVSALSCPLDRLPATGPLKAAEAAVVASVIVNVEGEFGRFLLALAEELTIPIASAIQEPDTQWPRRFDDAAAQVPQRRSVSRGGTGFTEWGFPPWSAQELLGHTRQPRPLRFHDGITPDAQLLFEWLTISPWEPGSDPPVKVDHAFHAMSALSRLADGLVAGRVQPATLRRGDGIAWRGQAVMALGIVDRTCRFQLHRLLGHTAPWEPNATARPRR